MRMTREQGRRYAISILSDLENTLVEKAQMYVRNEDMMHNFNTGAKLTGKLREEIMEDFRLKHIISRGDIVNDLKKDIIPSEELVREKYGDIIAYYTLELMSMLHRIEIEEPGKIYPFEEGDDYWIIQDGKVVWSCWDDVSEELYDPNTEYYRTEEDALKALKDES